MTDNLGLDEPDIELAMTFAIRIARVRWNEYMYLSKLSAHCKGFDCQLATCKNCNFFFGSSGLASSIKLIERFHKSRANKHALGEEEERQGRGGQRSLRQTHISA